MKTDQLRQLALALLNDDNGISEEAYDLLRALLEEHGLTDITDRVDATDGRFYLPHGID